MVRFLSLDSLFDQTPLLYEAIACRFFVKWDTMVEVMRSRLMELLAGCLAVCDMSPGARK